MTKTLRISIIALFLFQVLVSVGFELAHDEAYYWIYSKNLDWGYFDHPPFVGIVIKLFSFLDPTEFSVRIGFIVLQFLSLLILLGLTGYSLTTLLLFFAFPLASFTGLLALPDIPLLFMTVCFCYQLKKYLEKENVFNAVFMGIIIALGFYAKYHAVLLVFFTLIAIPSLFKRKTFYLIALIALLTFVPHLIWQYQHEFSTLRYHFIERPSSSFSLKRSLEFLALQIGLAGVFVGPFTWYALLKTKASEPFERAMKFIAVGTVLFFLFSSFSKKVEANWTIFLAIPIIYLTAHAKIWEKKWAHRALIASFSLVVIARLLFLLPSDLVAIKRLKEFQGWKMWSQDIKYVCEGKPILANSYQIASKLSFYLQEEVSALNYHSRKNQFDYWRFDRRIPTKEVCYVTEKNDFGGIEFKTPEGKSIRIVKNQGLEQLWELKYNKPR